MGYVLEILLLLNYIQRYTYLNQSGLYETSCIATDGPKKSFENVTEFKYLGRAVRNLKKNHEEVKGRIHVGNACYSDIQNVYLPASDLNANRLKHKKNYNFTCRFVWM
jgi:hypothetical protein